MSRLRPLYRQVRSYPARYRIKPYATRTEAGIGYWVVRSYHSIGVIQGAGHTLREAYNEWFASLLKNTHVGIVI
jgi:hypothetical protein